MAVVLVVDDRESDRDELVSLLRHAGHRTLEARDTTTALETIRAESPDLVLTDILMRGMDGYEFVHRLRSAPGIEQPRVVFCTSTYLTAHAEELATACGVSRVITTPADPEVILGQITAVLETDFDLPEEAPPEEFDRTHLRLISQKLVEKVEELEASNRERGRLVADLVTAQEVERARIAADVHDDSIQTMAAACLRLDMLRDDLTDPVEQEAVEAVAEKVRGAVERLRRLIFDLSLRSVEAGGLAAALEGYVREVGAEAGFEGQLKGETPAALPHEVQTILYRIAQEAIRNAQKHAQPAHVRVELGRRDGGTVMNVVDDGVGFLVEAADHRPGHVGLPSMRERADLAGGTFRLESTPGAGCDVEVWVPDAVPEAAT
jgi:signal transduction histidine kinase